MTFLWRSTNESGYVYHVGETVPYFKFSNNQLKNFAELIVRECCNMVNDEVECVYAFDNQHPVIARMKEHFGVE